MSVNGRGIGWKGWLAAHGEKVAALLALACMVMLMVSAANRKPLSPDLEPRQIEYAAQRALLNIESTTWDDFTDKPKLQDFSKQAMTPIPVAQYTFENRFDPPIICGPGFGFPCDKRLDPVLLPPRNLEVHFDRGPLAVGRPKTVRAAVKELPKEVQKQLGDQ